MRIRFQFDSAKALNAIVFLINRLGTLEKVRLMKLLYIADREHFIRHGRPITGDDLYAMPWGPVPSRCLSLVNGEVSAEKTFKVIDVHNNDVALQADQACEGCGLTAFEESILSEVAERYGGFSRWQLVKMTHKFPEYDRHYIDDTSTPIPFESILELHGDESKFRKNRPVISHETAAAMRNPFPQVNEEL